MYAIKHRDHLLPRINVIFLNSEECVFFNPGMQKIATAEDSKDKFSPINVLIDDFNANVTPSEGEVSTIDPAVLNCIKYKRAAFAEIGRRVQYSRPDFTNIFQSLQVLNTMTQIDYFKKVLHVVTQLSHAKRDNPALFNQVEGLFNQESH